RSMGRVSGVSMMSVPVLFYTMPEGFSLGVFNGLGGFCVLVGPPMRAVRNHLCTLKPVFSFCRRSQAAHFPGPGIGPGKNSPFAKTYAAKVRERSCVCRRLGGIAAKPDLFMSSIVFHRMWKC